MTVNFDGNAKVYDQRHGEFLSPDIIRELVELCGIGPDKTILDFATGTGRVGLGFAKQGYSITAIDISEDMLSKLSEKARELDVIVRHMRDDAIPYDGNQFDVVTAARVFYLIKDWQVSLDEISRVVKQGGVFLHEWGNGQASEPWVQVREKLRHSLFDTGFVDVFHPGVRQESEIETYLSSLGFSPLSVVNSGHGVKMTLRNFIGKIERRETSYLWNVPRQISEPLMEELVDWAAARFNLDKPMFLPRKIEWRAYRFEGNPVKKPPL